MAIKNELDLGIKYKQAIEVEVNKSQIQKPVQTVMPTQQSGFSVLPTNISTVKQPTLKKVEPVKTTQTYQQAISQQLPTTAQLQPLKTVQPTLEQSLEQSKTNFNNIVDNLRYVADTVSTFDDRLVTGIKQGLVGLPVQLSMVRGLATELAFEKVGLQSQLDFSVEEDLRNLGLSILQKDSAYLAGLQTEIQEKYKDKNINQITKIGSDLAGTIVDMIPMIATNTVLGGGGMAVMYASSSSRAIGDGLNQGLTSEQSGVYGALMGGLEVSTELLFDGIKGMESTAFGRWTRDKVRDFVPKVFGRVAQDATSSVFLKTIADSVGEGLEEVLTELGGFFIGKFYEIEERSGKELLEDTAYSFVLGSLSSVAMNIGYEQTMRAMEAVSNISTVHNLNKQQSSELSLKIAQKLGYNYQEITPEQAIEIAEKSGVDSKKAKNTTGFVDNNTVYVVDDGTLTNPIARTTMHEVFHILETTNEWNQIKALVKSHMGDVQFEEDVQKYRDLYQANKDTITARSKRNVGESEFIAESIIQHFFYF